MMQMFFLKNSKRYKRHDGIYVIAFRFARHHRPPWGGEHWTLNSIFLLILPSTIYSTWTCIWGNIFGIIFWYTVWYSSYQWWQPVYQVGTIPKRVMIPSVGYNMPNGTINLHGFPLTMILFGRLISSWYPILLTLAL